MRIDDILCRITPNQALLHILNHLVTVLDIIDIDTVVGAAVILTDNHILGNVDQAAGQITGVRSTKRGIGKSLSRTTGRNEVFQDIQPFPVVGANWNLNRMAGGVCNQSAHSGKLANLVHGTTRTGIRHHEDRVVLAEVVFQGIGNLIRCIIPSPDDRIVALLIRDKASAVLFGNLVNLRVRLCQKLFLLRRNDGVRNGNRNGSFCRVFIALGLDFIQDFRSPGSAVDFNAAIDNISKLFFPYQESNLKIQEKTVSEF